MRLIRFLVLFTYPLLAQIPDPNTFRFASSYPEFGDASRDRIVVTAEGLPRGHVLYVNFGFTDMNVNLHNASGSALVTGFTYPRFTTSRSYTFSFGYDDGAGGGIYLLSTLGSFTLNPSSAACGMLSQVNLNEYGLNATVKIFFIPKNPFIKSDGGTLCPGTSITIENNAAASYSESLAFWYYSDEFMGQDYFLETQAPRSLQSFSYQKIAPLATDGDVQLSVARYCPTNPYASRGVRLAVKSNQTTVQFDPDPLEVEVVGVTAPVCSNSPGDNGKGKVSISVNEAEAHAYELFEFSGGGIIPADVESLNKVGQGVFPDNQSIFEIPVPVGDHIMRVTDATTGCRELIMVEIPEFIPFSSSNVTQSIISPPQCPGEPARIRIGHAGKPFRISFSGQSTPINSAGGIVEVEIPSQVSQFTISDICGSSSRTIDFLPINWPDNFAINNLAITQPTCPDASSVNDGRIRFNVTGGLNNNAFTINLKRGNSIIATKIAAKNEQVTFDQLESGTYSVSCTEAITGCLYEENNIAVIANPLPLTATLDEIIAPSCHGEATGQVKIKMNNRRGEVTSSVSNFSVSGNTLTFSGMSAGNYNISVSDQCGLPVVVPVQISQPSALRQQSLVLTDQTCEAKDDGVVEIRASGGTGTLQYNLSGSGLNRVNTNGLFENLDRGNYKLSITDVNGCSLQINNLIIEVIQDSLDFTTNILPPDCSVDQAPTAGKSRGMIEVNTVNSTGIVSYHFGNIRQSVNRYFGAPQSYNVSVEDELGCRVEKQVSIPARTPIIENQLSLTGSDGFENGMFYLCDGNAVEFGATFSNLDNGVVSLIKASDIVYSKSYAGTEIKFNIRDEGDYKWLATDIRGCEWESETYQIRQPTRPALNITPQPADCDGEEMQINYAVESAFTVQQVKLFNFDGSLSDTKATGTGEFTGLDSGTYLMEIVDHFGCLYNDYPEIFLDDPEPLAVSSLAVKDVSCHAGTDGSITVTLDNIVGNLSYKLSSGVTQPADNPLRIPNLAADTYSFTVEDQCVQLSLSSLISEPDSLVISSNVSPVSCEEQDDGSIHIDVEGGNSPYQVSFAGAAWEPVAGDNVIINTIRTDQYLVRVRDANQCVISRNIDVPVSEFATEIDPSSVITLPPDCGTGQGISDNAIFEAALSPESGFFPFHYAIRSGDGTYEFTATKEDNRIGLNDLSPGDYVFSVVDSRSCTREVPFAIPEKDPIFLEVRVPEGQYSAFKDQSYFICPGETSAIFWSTDSYNGMYDLKLFNNDELTASRHLINDPDGLIDNLKDGNYVLVLEDALGCTTADTLFPVQYVEQPAVSHQSLTQITDQLSGNIYDISCHGGNNGRVVVESEGLFDRYEYFLSWQNNIISSSGGRNVIFQNLFAGNYVVSVIDSAQCSWENIYSLELEEPEPLDLSIGFPNDLNGFPVRCSGDSAMINFQISGGVAGFNIAITSSNGLNITEELLTREFSYKLPAGAYEILITDKAGCNLMDTFSIKEPQSLQFLVDITQPECIGESGEVEIKISGGVGMFQISRTVNEIENGSCVDITNLPASATGAHTNWLLPQGNYTFVVTDGNQCQSNTSIQMPAPSHSIELVVDEVISVTCFGNDDGAISVSGIGGKPFSDGYRFHLLNGVEYMRTITGYSALFDELEADEYEIYVEDENACCLIDGQNRLKITVGQPARLISRIISDKMPSCHDSQDGEIIMTATGGTGNYSFSVDGINFLSGDTVSLSQLTDIRPGDTLYRLFTRDDSYQLNEVCQTNNTFYLPAPPELLIDHVVIDKISCTNDRDGVITIVPRYGEIVGEEQLQISWFDSEGNLFENRLVAADLEAGSYQARLSLSKVNAHWILR